MDQVNPPYGAIKPVILPYQAKGLQGPIKMVPDFTGLIPITVHISTTPCNVYTCNIKPRPVVAPQRCYDTLRYAQPARPPVAAFCVVNECAVCHYENLNGTGVKRAWLRPCRARINKGVHTRLTSSRPTAISATVAIVAARRSASAASRSSLRNSSTTG